MKKLILFFATCVIMAGAVAQSNYVLNFNGTSNYVNLGSNAGNGLHSIEFWFKPAVNYNSSLSLPATIITRNTDDAGEAGEFSIFIGPYNWAGGEGRICFGVNGNTHTIYSNNNSWAAGVWHHVACVTNTVSGMEMYIDGVKQASTNAYTSATNVRTEMTAIGMWGDENNRFFNGAVDEVRFWNRPLTQSEIQQKMCLWLDPSNEAGLVGYWKMNEGSGTIINDMTTNGYHGIITGAAFSADNYCGIGIEETGSVKAVSISPNPFNLCASIHFDKTTDNARLSIFNIFGQEIKTIKNVSGQETELCRDGLPNGIYFIKVTQGGKVIMTDRIIIAD